VIAAESPRSLHPLAHHVIRLGSQILYRNPRLRKLVKVWLGTLPHEAAISNTTRDALGALAAVATQMNATTGAWYVLLGHVG